MPVKKPRRRRIKRIFFGLACSAAVMAACLALVLHKPAGFVPPDPKQDKEVSKYLTHVIGQEFYNGVQRREPFELVIEQDGVNDVLARLRWPRGAGGAAFSVPEALFVPGKLIVRGMVSIEGVELFVIVESSPFIDEKGLLNLPITKVKVGALRITTVAKLVAEQMYAREIAAGPVYPEDWGYKIAAALFAGQPFEPVIEIEGSKVRIEKLNIERRRLVMEILPVP